jgi:hypothetical protein
MPRNSVNERYLGQISFKRQAITAILVVEPEAKAW